MDITFCLPNNPTILDVTSLLINAKFPIIQPQARFINQSITRQSFWGLLRSPTLRLKEKSFSQSFSTNRYACYSRSCTRWGRGLRCSKLKYENDPIECSIIIPSTANDKIPFQLNVGCTFTTSDVGSDTQSNTIDANTNDPLNGRINISINLVTNGSRIGISSS